MTLQVLPLLALGWSPIAVPPPAAAVTRGGLLIGASAAGASSGQMVDGARIGPPPDMPSMLLNQRIVYLGLPLSAQVTELIIGQLLYLQYDSSEKPITMYINSPGTTLEVPTETPQLHAPAHCGSLPRPHLRTHLRVLPPRLSPPPASQRLSHPSPLSRRTTAPRPRPRPLALVQDGRPVGFETEAFAIADTMGRVLHKPRAHCCECERRLFTALGVNTGT